MVPQLRHSSDQLTGVISVRASVHQTSCKVGACCGFVHLGKSLSCAHDWKQLIVGRRENTSRGSAFQTRKIAGSTARRLKNRPFLWYINAVPNEKTPPTSCRH
jgi:hypothetical protein